MARVQHSIVTLPAYDNGVHRSAVEEYWVNGSWVNSAETDATQA